VTQPSPSVGHSLPPVARQVVERQNALASRSVTTKSPSAKSPPASARGRTPSEAKTLQAIVVGRNCTRNASVGQGRSNQGPAKPIHFPVGDASVNAQSRSPGG